MAAHRYWRINITKHNGGDVVSHAEVQFRATVGGADQATGGTPDASTENLPTYGASKAFDDDASTIWSSTSSSLPQWISYDFGSAVDVVEVALQADDTAPRALYAAEDFDVQYSDDNSSWTTAWSVTGENAWGVSETRVFTYPSSALYDQPNTEVDLSWTAPPGATAQHVLRATSPGGPYTDLGDAGASATSFSDVSVVEGTRYYYIIRATVDGTDYDSIEVTVVSALPRTGSDSFDGYGTGATPTGWTKTDTSKSTLTVADASLLDGYGLDIDPGNKHFAFTLDVLDDAVANYIEVLVIVYAYGDVPYYPGLALCVDDDGAGNMDGYALTPYNYISKTLKSSAH